MAVALSGMSVVGVSFGDAPSFASEVELPVEAIIYGNVGESLTRWSSDEAGRFPASPHSSKIEGYYPSRIMSG
jgi:hypothetical protein